MDSKNYFQHWKSVIQAHDFIKTICSNSKSPHTTKNITLPRRVRSGLEVLRSLPEVFTSIKITFIKIKIILRKIKITSRSVKMTFINVKSTLININ